MYKESGPKEPPNLVDLICTHPSQWRAPRGLPREGAGCLSRRRHSCARCRPWVRTIPGEATHLAGAGISRLWFAYEKGNDGDWQIERERLFRQEGKVVFDLFAPKAHELLSKSARLRALFSACHPMIVVDEAQDTAEDQWQCVRLLSSGTQLVCLADLEQQIYDFRPGVSSERVTHIMAALRPLRVDLEAQNHRSPNSEIVAFANDILLGTPRGAAYRGVSRKNFRANRNQRDKAIRQSIGIAVERAKAAAQEDTDSIAVLATWGRGVNVISRALTGHGTSNLIPHRVIIDEASVLMSSRMVAFLLEPRRPVSAELLDLAEGLELAAAVFRARGGNGNLISAQKLLQTPYKAVQPLCHVPIV
jgi:DNA helicase-2/ATP-dependent DNA helicase PcrA